MRVMMSAAGSAVAPGIIRHLQSLGHYVIGHDSNGFAEVKSPIANNYEYLYFVDQYYDQFDLYLPFLDEELRVFSSDYIAPKIFCSPNDTLEIFTSKVKQQRAFVKASLPIAPIAFCGEIVAKLDNGRGGKGIIRTDNDVITDRLAYSDYLTQKFIDGDEYTVDVLTGLDGEFLFAVPRLRIQANGVSIVGKIVMDDEIIDLARQVVRKFKFSGPINIQIIRERDTRKLYIIELNPRLSGSCMFTVMAGFDILDAAIKLHEGKPFVPPAKVEEITVRRHYVEERL